MSIPETLSIELAHYLTVSGVIFGIGIAIALSKRNAIAVLMGVELMLNAVNLAFVAFARFGDRFEANGIDPLAGHAFVVFVLTVAAAEAAVALAMAVLVYRRRETVDLDRINLMRW
ncbi:MAG TPA: NADH-quinone oxidoreductase subunit NuoK [Dehalococcoidia bacterium]|nr:NADH-quinone oxidoreductase subunit NuoK [Dehalococcoidia bacterium]